MPRRIWIRKETRMLGAIQIMNGLIIDLLGVIWTYLFVSQLVAFGKIYIPLAVLAGYPFWASLIFIASGILSVWVERKRSTSMVSYTIMVNVCSVCTAVIGLILLSLELLIFTLTAKDPIWSQKSGKILSEYLFLFTFLELFASSTVIYWGYRAKTTV